MKNRLLLLLIALALPSLAQAQAVRPEVAGFARDSTSSERLPAVNVVLTSLRDTTRTFGSSTNARGTIRAAMSRRRVLCGWWKLVISPLARRNR